MSVYIIKDENGNTINRINASFEFVAANFTHYELEQVELAEFEQQQKSVVEREWRDSELERTDAMVALTDRPDHAAYLAYRQKLREYPQQAGFPNVDRPQL